MEERPVLGICCLTELCVRGENLPHPRLECFRVMSMETCVSVSAHHVCQVHR